MNQWLYNMKFYHTICYGYEDWYWSFNRKYDLAELTGDWRDIILA